MFRESLHYGRDEDRCQRSGLSMLFSMRLARRTHFRFSVRGVRLSQILCRVRKIAVRRQARSQTQVIGKRVAIVPTSYRPTSFWPVRPLHTPSLTMPFRKHSLRRCFLSYFPFFPAAVRNAD